MVPWRHAEFKGRNGKTSKAINQFRMLLGFCLLVLIDSNFVHSLMFILDLTGGLINPIPKYGHKMTILRQVGIFIIYTYIYMHI